MHPPCPPAPCPPRSNRQLASLATRAYAIKTSVRPQAPAPSQAAAGTSKGNLPSSLRSETLRSGRGPKVADGSQGTDEADAGGASEGRETRSKAAELQGQPASEQQNKNIAEITKFLAGGAQDRRITRSLVTQVRDEAASQQQIKKNPGKVKLLTSVTQVCVECFSLNCFNDHVVCMLTICTSVIYINNV
jgi:hypothetical protein